MSSNSESSNGACDADSLRFSFVDWMSLGVYFVVLIGVAWSAGRSQGSSGEQTSFFLAEKGVVWWMVACSLLMSNIGAEHFIGLTGTAASSGVAVSLFEWFATGPIVFLAFVMLPVYMKSNVSTTLGYLKLRYGECVRQSVVALSLVLYVLTKISATLYAGGLVLAVVSGSAVSPLVSVVMLILLTLGYTAVGGLKAVVWTETLQTAVLFTGGLLILIFAVIESGGISEISGRMSPSQEAYPMPAPTWQEWAGDDLSGFCDHADAVPAAAGGTSAGQTGGGGQGGSGPGGGSNTPNWVQELCDSTRQLSNGTLIFTDPDGGAVSVLDDDSLEGLYHAYCGDGPGNGDAGAGEGGAGAGGNSSATPSGTSRSTMGAAWPGWQDVAAPYEGYDRMSLWRPVDDGTYPWTAMVFGLPTMAIWYWACDQVITQRALAAANIAHGEVGTLCAAILKLLPPFLLVIPGLAARSLMAQDGILPSFLPTKSIPPIVFDGAYPWLIGRVLPLHARGLVLAAVLASLMSSLASVFNSAGTVFALDVYSRCLCCRAACENRCLECHDAVDRCGGACCGSCQGGCGGALGQGGGKGGATGAGYRARDGRALPPGGSGEGATHVDASKVDRGAMESSSMGEDGGSLQADLGTLVPGDDSDQANGDGSAYERELELNASGLYGAGAASSTSASFHRGRQASSGSANETAMLVQAQTSPGRAAPGGDRGSAVDEELGRGTGPSSGKGGCGLTAAALNRSCSDDDREEHPGSAGLPARDMSQELRGSVEVAAAGDSMVQARVGKACATIADKKGSDGRDAGTGAASACAATAAPVAFAPQQQGGGVLEAAEEAAAAALFGLPATPPEAVTVWIGRLAILGMGVLSILWLPVIPLMGDQLFAYVQKPPAYFAGPVSAVFVWGACSRRVNNWGAIAGLAVGWTLGLTRFIGDIVIAATREQGADDHHVGGITGGIAGFFSVHYMHFSAINFLAASCALLVASFATAAPSESQVENTTFRWGLAGELLQEQKLQTEKDAEQAGEDERKRLLATGRMCCCGLEEARAWLRPGLTASVLAGTAAVVALYWGNP